MPFNPRSLSLYPDQPGVYLMKDITGRVLYIGKAKNLRNRLKQYFGEGGQPRSDQSRSGDGREMVPYLTAQVETIDTVIALTEKDALILENTLIKKHQPKYNVLLKDGKTFISLLLTQHSWPMLRIIRNQGKEKGRLFGPYTNALAARQTYDLVMRLFPLRQCSDREFAIRKRPCLLYDVKKCLAPCVGKCSEEEYQKLVEGVARLLKGQDKEIVQELTREMHLASSKLEFEKADRLLQTIRQIEHVTTVQHVDNPFAKDCDVLGLHREADAVLIVILSFREGKIVGSEHFSFHLIASEDAELFESFLLQHYPLRPNPPQEVLLPCELPHAEALQDILQLKVEFPKRGKKSKLLEMARRNAKALFTREINERSLLEKMLLDLQEKLQLTRYPRRIECFDTSHLFSTDPVASLCCFVHGERDKSRTRLFRIKTSKTSEDYASMREVLRRHFTREKETGDFCDLLVVDGGKGQLNIALEVFLELGIASVDVIALTKESARHDKGLTQEAIYLPHSKDPILIDPRSPMLFLLQRIRDEAHRMAIEYHRKRRTKRTIQSALDDLPGIGPIKRRRLLTYYGSVRALKAASKDSLQNVDGLTKKDVERIWEFISSGETK